MDNQASLVWPEFKSGMGFPCHHDVMFGWQAEETKLKNWPSLTGINSFKQVEWNYRDDDDIPIPRNANLEVSIKKRLKLSLFLAVCLGQSGKGVIPIYVQAFCSNKQGLTNTQIEYHMTTESKTWNLGQNKKLQVTLLISSSDSQLLIR